MSLEFADCPKHHFQTASLVEVTLTIPVSDSPRPGLITIHPSGSLLRVRQSPLVPSLFSWIMPRHRFPLSHSSAPVNMQDGRSRHARRTVRQTVKHGRNNISLSRSVSSSNPAHQIKRDSAAAVIPSLPSRTEQITNVTEDVALARLSVRPPIGT